MWNSEFLLLLERWAVIPLIGYLIAHGFFAANDKEWLIPLLDNLLAVFFVIVAYILTHKRVLPPENTIVGQSLLSRLWERVSGFVFNPKATQTAPVTDPISTDQPTP